MRVMVTGDRGFLGAFLRAELVSRGHRVTGIDSHLYEACGFPDGPDLPDGDGTCRDVRDLTPEACDGCDAVIHLAGLSNDPLGSFDPALTDRINRGAAVHVARTAREGGVGRFLFASTCSVYGGRGEGIVDETADPQPLTPYALAKAQAEVEIAGLAAAGFAPVFLRPGTVFGLGPRPRFDLVLNNLVAWAAATGEVRLKSDGAAWRPLVHARDVARAFVGLLEAPSEAVAGQVFNVATDRNTLTVRALADQIVAQMPGVALSFAPGAGRDQRNYRVSGARLEALLGADWAREDIGASIADIAATLARHSVPVEAFEGPRFQRLAALRSAMAEGRLTPDLRNGAKVRRQMPGF